MLFDTDVLVWFLRGNPKAAALIEDTENKMLSVISYMELLQGARNSNEINVIRRFLKNNNFTLIPLKENIGHRASVYMEQYCLKVDLCMAHALIAATSIEIAACLCTANKKHYKVIADLELKVFRP